MPAKKALVLTVGVGKDVDWSLERAIDEHHPDFILFLCTPQSRPHAEKVIQKLQRPSTSYEVDESPHAEDVQALALHYEDTIRRVLMERQGFAPEEIYVDYTRGTKAMSAALDYVAINLELGGISYIGGESRDERGQVITGKERVLSFRPAELVFRRHWRLLVHLFNAGHFAGVLAYIRDELSPRTADRDHRRRLDFMERLAEAYEAWDALHYEKACAGLRRLLRDFGDLLEESKLKEDAQRACRIVHQIWDSRCSSGSCACGLLQEPGVALDLLAHADRRAQEHRYDVAVALLYRLMEYITQKRLHEWGFQAGNIAVERLPGDVRKKWDARKGPDERLKVAMVQGFELLADLGDPLGQKFLEEYRASSSRLKAYLESRNMSPLAHGFQPLEENVFRGLRAVIADEFLPEVVPDGSSRLPDYQFPRLNA